MIDEIILQIVRSGFLQSSQFPKKSVNVVTYLFNCVTIYLNIIGYFVWVFI